MSESDSEATETMTVIDFKTNMSYSFNVKPEVKMKAEKDSAYAKEQLIEHINKGKEVHIEEIEVLYPAGDTSDLEKKELTPIVKKPTVGRSWTDQETALLIEYFREEKLHSLVLKHEKAAAWQRVCDKLNATLLEQKKTKKRIKRKRITLKKCKEKMDQLKRHYKEIINQKKRITWRHFDAVHELFASEEWLDPSLVNGESDFNLDGEPHPQRSKTTLSVCEDLLAEWRRKNKATSIYHRDKRARMDRLNNTLESIAQSMAVIAAATKNNV